MGSEREAQRVAPQHKKYRPRDILGSYGVDIGSRSAWIEVRENNSIVTRFLEPLKLATLPDQKPNHFVQLVIAEWRYTKELLAESNKANQLDKRDMLTEAKRDELREAKELLDAIRGKRKELGSEMFGDEHEQYVLAIKAVLPNTKDKEDRKRQELIVTLRKKFLLPDHVIEEKAVQKPSKKIAKSKTDTTTKAEIPKQDQLAGFTRAKQELAPLINEKEAFLRELAFSACETALAVYKNTDGTKETKLNLESHHHKLLRNPRPDSLTVTTLHIVDHLSGKRGSHQTTEKINYTLFTRDPLSENGSVHSLESDGFASSSWVESKNSYDFSFDRAYNTTDELKNDYALVHMGEIVSGIIVVGLLNAMAAECDIEERITLPENTAALWKKWSAVADSELTEKFISPLSRVDRFFVE